MQSIPQHWKSSHFYLSRTELRRIHLRMTTWTCLNVLAVLPTSESSFASNRLFSGLSLSLLHHLFREWSSVVFCSLFRLYYLLIKIIPIISFTHSLMPDDQDGDYSSTEKMTARQSLLPLTDIWRLIVGHRRGKEVLTTCSSFPLVMSCRRGVYPEYRHWCLVANRQH